MQGRDGTIRRDGAGPTMRGSAGGCHLLALVLHPAPLIVLATTINRVLTLLPAEARLTRHLVVQQLHLGGRLLAVLLRHLLRPLYTPLIRLLRLVPLALLDLPFKAGARAQGVSVLLLLLVLLDLGKRRSLNIQVRITQIMIVDQSLVFCYCFLYISCVSERIEKRIT